MSGQSTAGGQVPPGGQQPSEEELRQYLGEMRQAHVGEVVAQVVSALLNGAQVKLGRRDARLLLDLAASVSDQAGPHLDAKFSGEVGQVITQLRMAQVEAEQELAKLRASGQAPPEANDLGSEPSATPGGDTGDDTGDAAPPQAPQPPQAPPPQQPQRSAASRLWTPGQ